MKFILFDRQDLDKVNESNIFLTSWIYRSYSTQTEFSDDEEEETKRNFKRKSRRLYQLKFFRNSNCGYEFPEKMLERYRFNFSGREETLSF